MKEIEILSPYNLELIQKIELIDSNQANTIISNAENAFSEYFPNKFKHKLIPILQECCKQIKLEKDEFAKLISLEGGKPLKDSLIEVSRAIESINIAVGHLHCNGGKEIPMNLNEASKDKFAITLKQPSGIVLAISAFNHPLNLIIHQVIPALCAGCPVIIKPALETALTCIKFVDILHKAGLDKRLCQILLADNEITEEIAKDERISILNFIGSAKVGFHLKRIVAPACKIILEHGGTAPIIIDKSCNYKKIIPRIVKSAFYHAGQVCISLQNLIIHEEVYKDFKRDLLEETRKLNHGDPLEEQTDIGPIIRSTEFSRISNLVTDAKQRGAIFLTGGKKFSETIFEATIIENVTTDMLIYQEEAFAPILNLFKFNEFDKALKIANSKKFSFQAAIFTNNYQQIIKAKNELHCKTLLINESATFRVDWMPFGGLKHSGFGTGGILDSIDAMSEEKQIIFNEE